MTIEEFRELCLSLPGTTEDLPFDESTLAFKVMGKIFAITDIDNFEYVNLKCDPETALELRDRYEAIKAGYHMNKKHWNSVYFSSDANDSSIKEWTMESYRLVKEKLPAGIRKQLEE
ncbi:hypothetical protein FUAX_43100 (plasmid) [Fulvitalea axinellae]|uniref:MmcQ/YjbR family DNA-binding protein n=1 Tax=Fulvitalea axinellae TaxID=1182444 RepID=A0AAU9CNK7_9BACT|nr:hypothetical protein FUAX_43100 [Fulvitalea axinellae]